MIGISECPVCKSKSLKSFIRCIDYTVSHETFLIACCEDCGLGITTPRPETEKLGAYYQSEEYVSHSGKSSGGLGSIYKTARSFTLRWKSEKISQQKATGSLLDFGCGTGEFLETVKKKSWAVEGVEPSDAARLKAESVTAQKIHSALSQIPDTLFDVITAWHVIEHVPDLQETIQKLKLLLKKDGIIFIAVPNYQSPDAAFYKEHWAGFDVPRHLWHFSKASMTRLLESNGLNVMKIEPMKLDAYYVSMLSEKYRNENALSVTGLAKGFFSGLRSNSTARTNTNHSSLLYIAKNS